VRHPAIVAVLLLVACSTPAPAVPIERPAAPTPTRSPSAFASASPNPSGAVAPIEATLPTLLGAVELHTFAVGQDILLRLADRLAVSGDAFEVAYASEHGARFLQIYALRLDETDAEALSAAWAEAAYPPDVSDIEVADDEIEGRAVTVVDAPSARSRLGSFYLRAVDETLFVVQAFDREVAAEALSALP
jgi:hypothetical protein